MIATSTYLAKRGASLRALDQEIRMLTNYAALEIPESAVKYREAVRGLQATRDAVAGKLRKLRAVRGNEWSVQAAMNDVEDAWNDVRDAVCAAIAAI